jgi:riboflavin kinase/FMN adenylyltransferase
MGQVVQGQQLGRTIGFPTANLKLSPDKFLPRQGVYCVRVSSSVLGNRESPLSGVMNLGYRPTVDGTYQTVEIHLLDWSGDLYGHTLTVSLEQFLRPEQKFASLDALKTQIQADCAAARAILTSAPTP